MRFRRTERFRKSYRKLSKEDKERAKKALFLLGQNIYHPSLRVKKVKGETDIFEARAGSELRFTFEYQGDLITLRVIGRHDEVLRKP